MTVEADGATQAVGAEAQGRSLRYIWPTRTRRCPGTRVFAAVVRVLSPIDLIPDPIPVLGYLDDLVIIPLGSRSR